MNNTSILKSLAFAGILSIGSQVSAQEAVRLAGAKAISYQRDTKLPNFIRFGDEQTITSDNFVEWAMYAFNLPSTSTLKPYSVEKDELGFTHTRYKEYVNGFPIEGTMVITHSKDGKLRSVNGDYYQAMSSSYASSLSEANALQYALKKVNAQRYMWENEAFEMQERESTNNPNFTFKPKGELVVVHKNGTDYSASSIRLAYKFNIYAEVPLYRADVYVDANNGEILGEHNQICTVNAIGTAVTKFSGTVTMTSDNTGTNAYRLRETGRGNGINTYNMNNGTTYSQTDFTNTSSTWSVTGTNQAASDAHWGAEMTYDYYKNIHNRNSIDNAGYALNSYMHYSNNYVNAFWDGTRMTYGDGQVSQGFLIMTALDVCGHEISHGLTSFTSQLGSANQTSECDALNEGNSDIFGTTIEAYARPTQNDWIIGADITCTSAGVQNHLGIRDMSNPNAFQQPDTYLGTYWDTQGEPHNNNGPFIYWYYLLCQGGSGTNDIGNAFNVTGITMAKAKFIAFRGNTVYFTPSTTYNDARTYMLEAATDLYGACSQELAATTNAWYAVGVGAAATNGVPVAAFAANTTTSCSAPMAVQFANNTTGATTYAWSFGDGSTSTSAAPTHTYTTPGVYPVKLVATGTCSANSKDSLLKTSYITVNGPPSVTSTTAACGPQAFTLNANAVGNVTWYDASGTSVGTGATYTTPTLTSTTTYSATSSVITAGTIFVSGGPALNTTLGAGGYLNASHYLIFNVSNAFTLKSVDVYAQSATSSQVTIQLQDNTGNVLQSISPTTGAGLNTITLNWHIAAGTAYRLVANGTNINLYRNNAGATYPIAVSTVASITGTDVTSTAPAYYYWFYNWKVAADAPCYSTASVITTSVTTCSATGIAANNAQSSSISVYPNPAHNTISVNVEENTSSVSVVDVIGQTIIAEQKVNGGQQVQTLDIANLSDGIYFIKVLSTDNQIKVIRFIKN